MNDSQRMKAILNPTVQKEFPLSGEELRELRSNPSLLIDTGYEFVEMGQFREAFELFRMGAASNHQDPDILNGLGITLCEMGRLEESRQILRIAVDLTPDDAITLANMAGVLWEMNEHEEAIHYYRMSLAADHEIEETHFNLINLYMEIGYLFMAFIHCQEFIDTYGENEEAREMMEDIILNLGISII